MTIRDDLLKPVELKRKTIKVDRLGEITVQEMSGSAGARYEMYTGRKGIEEADNKFKLITLCVIDEDGQTVFAEDDIPKIKNWPLNSITQLVFGCMQVCGFLQDSASEKDFEKEFIA